MESKYDEFVGKNNFNNKSDNKTTYYRNLKRNCDNYCSKHICSYKSFHEPVICASEISRKYFERIEKSISPYFIKFYPEKAFIGGLILHFLTKEFQKSTKKIIRIFINKDDKLIESGVDYHTKQTKNIRGNLTSEQYLNASQNPVMHCIERLFQNDFSFEVEFHDQARPKGLICYSESNSVWHQGNIFKLLP